MLKICKHCKEEFETKDKRQKYCDRLCSNKDRKSIKLTVHCNNCNKELQRYPSEVLKNVYCSRDCMKKFNSVRTKCDICNKEIVRKKSHYDRPGRNYCSYECSNKGLSKFYSGENNPNFLNTYTNCSYCDKEIYRKKSEFDRSVNFFCSVECHGKWNSIHKVGEKHPNYDKTLSEEDRVEGRILDGYWAFRKSVYERDKYQCQVCGYDKGGILNAHHLNSFHWDKENRLNIDNAVTLCEVCHKDFHFMYGNKNNTKEQFVEYIKDKAL